MRAKLMFAVVLLGAAVLAGAQPRVAKSDAQDEVQRHIQAVESCLPPPVIVKGEASSCTPLSKRMEELHIPGVSVAVVHNGVIEWAKGYGVEKIGGDPVTVDTIFQAGSISKPIAAMAALHLVQEGKLSLDGDVNASLKSWQIPASAAAPGAVVTLRELLTHTAGFTVHGFAGYAANTPVPTLLQVLNGEPPANSVPIRLESVPGSAWQYSGGGYEVMQQLLLDTTHEPFPKLLHDSVLAPIGMTHSTYEQPLPAALMPNAAMPYSADGKPVEGGPHTYPEMAAAGLWTTPTDLAKYLIEVQESLQGKANHVLSQAMTEQMLTAGKGHWGLGVALGGPPSDPSFSHGGDNAGYENLFVAYERDGNGAAVMTNAQGGSQLASAVMRAIAAAYDWPDYRPAIRTEVKVDPAVLSRYVGTYEISPHFSVTVMVEGDQLMVQGTNQPQERVYPESQTKFFSKVADSEIEFLSNSNGQVTGLVIHVEGQEFKGTRK